LKILCLTDSLNSGGAQRQLCMLAVLLKDRGYDVSVLTYYKFDFYKPLLDDALVPSMTIEAANKPARILAVRRAIRKQNPDVVIAYQETPSLFAELAGLPQRDFALVVSERSSNHSKNFATKRRFFFHRLSDAVVCNSFTQTKFIAETAPWLIKRTATIVNCVDLSTFSPSKTAVETPQLINIVVIASFQALKNPMGLVEAMNIVHNDKGYKNIAVNWYGNNLFVNGQPAKGSRVFLAVKDAIQKYNLENVFSLRDPVLTIAHIYQSATALCLPSLYEGCSNVIGEAMACGKPVLVSNVCDNPLLVTEGDNGFLFDPTNPEDIAAAIIRFAKQSPAQWKQMGQVSRQRAEKLLSPDAFVNKYIELIEQVIAKRKRI
jgi:glycosyltransferase involved in cell wall biosynthesis